MRSIASTSNGSCTTQMVVWSRAGLSQTRHGSASVMFWHREQKVILAFTLPMASASDDASSAGMRIR